MRLLILASAYPPDTKGGGEISTQLLAEAMSYTGHTVEVLTISEKPAQDIVNDVPVERIKSPSIYWNYKKKAPAWKNLVWHMLENWNPWAKHVVGKKIKSFKPDLLVTSTSENFGCNAWTAAKKAGIPAVHILRSHNTMCTNSMMFKNGKNCDSACAKCNVFCMGKKIASQNIEGVIGVSHYVLTMHTANGYFSNVKKAVVPNMISIPDIVTTNKDSASPPHREMQQKITFGYIGRIMEEKGLDPLIKAWKELANDTPTKLVIAGTGDAAYVQKLKDQLAGYDVEFAGWIGQEDFFPLIDYLVIPSILREVLGRVVIEGFAHGVPALGSTQGGIQDMIKEGENGFLFDPFDPAQLGSLMRKVSTDRNIYKTLSENALKSCNNYSRETLSKRYEEYFQRIINANRSGI